MAISELAKEKCTPQKGGQALTETQIAAKLKRLTGWEIHKGELVKTYPFKNYYETMAFVNAAAWISHREDHHPDLNVGYNKCQVHYSTHDVQGLSNNDFICAAKLDALFEI